MSTKIRKKEVEKKQAERSEYIGTMADKVLFAAEEIFEKAERKPTGNDMIDIMALASVFALSRQIKMHCKSVTTAQSVMKSVMWSLVHQVNTFAAPMLEKAEVWNEMFDDSEKKEGKDGRTES